jgi:hypothetical protein
MVNHDVLERLNVETNPLRSPEGLVVKATKAIHAGEEILYTYNYCTDCFDMGDVWGTPGMYRDFGFLEDYPQTWPFLDQDIYARVDKEEDGTLTASFEEGEGPAAGHVAFFATQLSRLQEMDIQSEVKSLTSSLEIFMIQQLYDSMKGALTAIVKAIEDDDDDDDDDDGPDDVGVEL